MLECITSSKEIDECVDLYLNQNDYTFLPANRDLALKNLSYAVRTKKFVRVLKQDNKIVSWIYADKGTSLHIDKKILQQYYYCSILKGVPAVRSVKLFHKQLIDYAESLKFELVISTGSHLDELNIFTKILEKAGWERRGYIALYKTSHYN